MADRVVKKFEDELNGRTGPAARLRGTPALAFAAAPGSSESDAPPVYLRARVVDQEVHIEVENEGPGIDPAVRERLFERFVTTRRDTGGTGLGLAIVAAVAEQHGGGASVSEAGPPRTRFLVRLPRANATLHQIFS